MSPLRLALRHVLKTPGFALVVVLTLGIGIGANTAMFTVARTLLLQPLPWPDSHRVLSVWEGNASKKFPQAPMAAAQFLDLRRDARSFSAVAAWTPAAVNLAGDQATPERHPGALVTEDFFKVIGIGPALGAPFEAGAFQPGRDAVVLISDAVWRQRFQAARDIVGRPIQINGRTREIVGVMPPGFQSPGKAAFWVPKVFSPQELQDRDYKSQYVLARLTPGVGLATARAETETLFATWRAQFPDVLEGWEPVMHPALEDLVKPVRSALMVLLAAVGVVLVLACLNVTSLLLGRADARRGELGVRAALGAGRGRLAAQSLVESLAIACAGGVLGILVAQGLLALVLAIAPPNLPRMEQVRLDTVALGYTAGICMLTALIAGVGPALHQSRANPIDALRVASTRSTARLGGWRRALVIVQVAGTVVVLIATGLLMRSLDRLLRRDLGFDPENLLTVRLELPPIRYAAEHRRDQFAEDVLSRLTGQLGVAAAAASTYLPLQGWPQFIMRLEENPVIRPSDAASTGYTGVSHDYFQALGMRLLRGRAFTSMDREDSVPVCVVNEAFARTHFDTRDPIGRRLEIGFSEPPQWIEIVGVVNDTQNAQFEAQPKEQVFVPLRQQPAFLRGNPALSMVVRGARPGDDSLGDAIRSAVWAVDRNQPLHQLQPMTRVLQGATAERRFTVTILAAFGASTVLLAAIGLYGMLGAQVRARTREVGIRMVVGARRQEILGLVLRSGAATLLAGTALGAVGGGLAARMLRSQMFETPPLDALTWSLVLVTVGVVGLAATLVPAWRAASVDPVVVLKSE